MFLAIGNDYFPEKIIFLSNREAVCVLSGGNLCFAVQEDL
jgi:hypothetical protein